jgi:AsmA protein
MTFLKKFLVAFTLIVFIIFIAIVILTKTSVPVAIKEFISKEITQLTSLNSQINGPLSWRFFPHPGIQLSRLSIGDDHAPMKLTIENALLNIQVTPFLSGHLIVNDLKLDGVELNINLDAPTHSPPAASRPLKNTNLAQTAPARFAIENFLMTRSAITIHQGNTSITLSDLQLGANQLNVKNQDFPLQIKTVLQAVIDENQLKTRLSYQGQIRLKQFTANKTNPQIKISRAEGQLILQKFKLNQLNISKINATALLSPENIVLAPFNISLYKGTSVGSLDYQLNTKQLTVQQSATQIDSNLLFKDLTNQFLIKGPMDFSIRATTNLNQGAWKNALNGAGNLTIKDGSLLFIDLNQLADDITQKIHTLLDIKNKDPKATLSIPTFTSNVPSSGSTSFELLSIQYKLGNLKLINDNVLLQTNILTLKGQGQINLQDGALNGAIKAHLSSVDPSVNTVQQLLGDYFPLILSGTFERPAILPDSKIINPILSRLILTKALEKPVKQLKEQVGDIVTIPAYLLNNDAE